MKLIYTAGPITADTPSLRFKNCMRAWEFAHQLWMKGIGVICPQFNTLFMDAEEIPHGTFMKADFEMITRACDAMLMLPGWEDSPGSQMEFELACKHNIPVFYCGNLDDLFEFCGVLEVEDALH